MELKERIEATKRELEKGMTLNDAAHLFSLYENQLAIMEAIERLESDLRLWKSLEGRVQMLEEFGTKPDRS